MTAPARAQAATGSVQPSTALGDAIDSYLISMEAEGKSEATVLNGRYALRRLERFAQTRGCTSPEQLTPEVLRGALAWTLAEGRRAADNGNALMKGGDGMAALMRWAARGLARFLREEGVDVSDLRSVRRVKIPERLQPRVRQGDFLALQHAAKARISAAAAGERWAGRARRSSAPRLIALREDALVRFLADTGLRAGEVSRLDMADVDLEHGVVTVHQGKGQKPRLLGIWDPALPDGGPTVAALRSYIAERGVVVRRLGVASRAFWIGVRGGRLSRDGLRRMLRNLCVEAGINGNRAPHAFRRGWFTESYRADPRELPLLRARMGWSRASEALVSVYTRGAEMEFAAEPRSSLSSRWERQAG